MAEHCDVAVIGAGPAGLAAARAAAGHGLRVALIDAQARPGGQVWRHDAQFASPRSVRRCMRDALHHRGVRWFATTRVVVAEGGRLLLESSHRARWLPCGAIVLATGARELLLPFPGWTLPGVTGAGGLQALAKQGWPLAGRRVLVAGSGPLLWAAAATARRHGARVLAIHEQAPRERIKRFAGGLWRWPQRLLQAAGLRTRLAGVAFHCGSVVTAARGGQAVREVELEGAQGRQRVACDLLAVGYGLVPNVELARMLGCRLALEGAHPRVLVDAQQRSSIENVYAVGEACGIGGRDCALLEGAIAGHAVAGAMAGLGALQRRRDHARRFAAHLAAHFVLDSRTRTQVQPDTLVCRCEDVPMRALEGFDDACAAKLATRCGMGACQGRICGSALAELGRFPLGEGQRPPLFPARLETLAEPDHGLVAAAAPGAER